MTGMGSVFDAKGARFQDAGRAFAIDGSCDSGKSSPSFSGPLVQSIKLHDRFSLRERDQPAIGLRDRSVSLIGLRQLRGRPVLALPFPD